VLIDKQISRVFEELLNADRQIVNKHSYYIWNIIGKKIIRIIAISRIVQFVRDKSSVKVCRLHWMWV